ncbi:MAG: hypothetical protein WCK86_08130, partial [Planctomycetia bacterium]
KEQKITGIGVNGVAEHVEGSTWRYRFSGRFEPGQVYVRFHKDSWSDNAGNLSLEKIETFNVYSNAASFEIIVQGSAELYGAVEDLKLVSIKGEAKLSLDISADDPSARIQLDLNGRADVMYFGTVGAVSGRFIFEIKPGGNSGFWGVMKMDTNFEKLRPAGIDMDATGYLQFNFSNETKIETLTLPGQGPGGSDLTETYTLAPWLFAFQAAGKLIFHVPDFNEDTNFGMQLFRVSGAFAMEISKEGLEVLAQGTIEIGPEDLDLFDLNVVGVLAIKKNVFAADLIISATAGVDGIAKISGDFRLVTNVSGLDQEVKVPQRFIDGGYFDQDFLDRLSPTADPNDDAKSMAYVVPAGAPKWGGGYGPAGFYAVMQGEGEMYLLDLFTVEAAFRIEVSTSGLFIQADGGVVLKDIGKLTATGYLELTKKGLIAAFTLDFNVPALKNIGINVFAKAELVINTTDEDRLIEPLTDRLLLEPILVEAGDVDIKAEGLLAFNLPGTDFEMARISGVFSLDTSTEQITIFAAGELHIGPRGLRVFTMTVLGVFALVEDGFALDLSVTATGGIPSIAELTGTFRLVANMTKNTLEVPVPQRFIDSGALSSEFVNRLQPSSQNPNRKSYYVPAGAPYLDSNNTDAPSFYVVMMGQGTLTLVDTFDITAGFRIKIDTNGPVIPIDATVDLGPLGWVTVFGKAELRVSGLTCALSVEMDAPGLRQAGLDFDVDAVIGINTSSKEVVIVSETNPNAQPIVIPPKTSYFRAGGLVAVRVPQTSIELFRMQGMFLMEINTYGLAVFVDASILVGPAVDLINASVTGVFIVTADGLGAELDLEFSAKSDVFRDAFSFNVEAMAAINTTGQELGIIIPERFMQYLSPRAKGRLKSPAPGMPATAYTVPAGAPLINGGYAPPGFYIVFSLQGFVRIADVFDLTGSFQMVFSNDVFQVTFDAYLRLTPFGDVTTWGFLQIDDRGLVGALNVQMDAPGLRAAGLDIDVDAVLAINTTDFQVTVSSEQNPNSEKIVIPQKTTYIRAGGLIGVRVPQTDIELFRMQGLFLMELNSYGLAVFVDASISVGAAADLIYASVTGVFMVTSDGLAADIDLVFSAKSKVFEDVFSFNVEARAAINTTGKAMGIIIPDRFIQYLSPRAKSRLTSPGPGLPPTAYTVPAGAPLLGGGYAAPGFYIVFSMSGFVRIVKTFDVNGSFQMVFANNAFEVQFDAQMRLDPIGQVDVGGILAIDQRGLIGALQLGGRFELGPMKIFGAMQLEINTTNSDRVIERVQYDFKSRNVSPAKVPVILPHDSQRIFVGGVMEIPGFNLEGSFELVNNPNEIRVSVDASFRAFDALFLGINGTVAIVKGNNAGLVINVGAYLKSGFFGIDGIFDLNAAFQLKVNTRPGSGSDSYDYGVQRGYTRIAFNGSMKLMSVIDLQVSGFIEAYLGLFRAEINGYASTLGHSIYGSGYLSSEGEFRLAFGGSLQIGPPGFGVSGSAFFEISRLDGNGTEAFGDGNYYVNVYGMVQGSVQLFGVSLLGASIQFGLEGPTGRVYITPKVKILFWEVETTFNLFYVKVPPPIYLAGNSYDSGPAIWQKGALYLNIGARAGYRNISPGELNEGIVVNRLGDDPDYPGEILQIEAFGRRQNFRGVTSIVADGGSGHDYIEIGPGVKSPVYLRGGASKDFIRSYGLGAAVIDGGEGDDELQGGFGPNKFVFSDGFGQDNISVPHLPGYPFENTFDLSGVGEGLTGEVSGSRLLINPDGYNDRIIGTATLNGREVKLVPLDSDTAIGVLPGHGLSAGDRFFLSAPGLDGYNGEFVVSSATADSFTFDAYSFFRSPPRGIPTDRGQVYHDGKNTAFIRTSIPNWRPDYELPLTSSAGGYNGIFRLTKLNDNLYSFSVPYADVRTAVDTDISSRQIILGKGDDSLTIQGNYAGDLTVDASVGGFDTLEVKDNLASSLFLVNGDFTNKALHLVYSGVDRFILRDPTCDLTLQGSQTGQFIQLGAMELGVVARSVTLPVDVHTPSLELNVRDQLSITSNLYTLDLNLRVFGDNSGIHLTNPIVAAGSVQLVAPNGTITLPAGQQITSSTVVIKARKLSVPEDRLNISSDQLTLITAQGSGTSVQLTNDRDLTLTNVTDTVHLVNLDSGIAAIFQGITWVSGVASAWADQLFDGRLNPYAVIVDGLLTIDLPAVTDSGDEDTLNVVAGLRSHSGDIRINADEIDLLGGPGSVQGIGGLSLQSATPVWKYRLGTSAETSGGSPIDSSLAAKTLDLPTSELAAFADGFQQITIGRDGQGNAMRLGDAFDMTTVKATGQTRVVDARIKDNLHLLADQFIVEGDFRSPLDTLTLTGNSAEIRRVNLHTPNNANPDSGLRARNLTLNLQDTLSVGGWLVADTNLQVSMPTTNGLFSLVVDQGGAIRQTGDVGSLSVSGSSGIRVAGEISTVADGVHPVIQAGTRFDLLAGGDLAATGDNAVLTLEAEQSLTLPIGSTVRAGVLVDLSTGKPVYTTTGTNGQIHLRSSGEVLLAGLVVSSGGMSVSAKESVEDHSTVFDQIVGSNTGWYLNNQERYAILVTGTVDLLGANEDLVLSASDDIVMLGNITMQGSNSSVTLQSDHFVFAEGQLSATKTVSVLGGVSLDGILTGGADIRGTSVYLGSSGRINATASGSQVIIRGGQDVDVNLPLIAGGTVGATGVTWIGEGSSVEVTAGQQIYLNAPIQAAGSISLNPGNPGADDSGKNLIFTDTSGLNAAGLGANGTGSVIRFESNGDLQIPVNIVCGGTIRQTFGSQGQLLSETYEWSGRDSRIEVAAAGRVIVGADTVDIYGAPVKKGVFLRADRMVSINAGDHASGTSLLIYPGGGVSAADATGRVEITATQDVDAGGYIAAGGDILLVQDASGVTTGYSVPSVRGNSSVTITAGHQVRIAQVLAAGKTISLEGGVDPVESDQPWSGQGVLLQGSARLFTAEPKSEVILKAPQAISLLTPAMSSESVYAISAPGAGSTVSLQIPVSAGNEQSHVYIGNRIYVESKLQMSSGTPGIFNIESFELDLAGAIEVQSGSIEMTSARSMDLKGSLISRDGSVIVSSDGDLVLNGRIRGGQNVTVDAGSGPLSLRPASRVDAGGTLRLEANGDLQMDGPVGALVAPRNLLVTSLTGEVRVPALTGNMTASDSIVVKAPRVLFDGVLSTTGTTAATGDFEVQIIASERLQLTGAFHVAGSVLIDAPEDFSIFNFTATQTDSASRWKLDAADDLYLGRLVTDISGAKQIEGVQISAAGGLEITTAGSLTVPAGSKLAVSSNDARIQLNGAAIEVSGVLLAGAAIAGDGTVSWTGRSASIEITGQDVAIGGLAPNESGAMVTRGAAIQATGAILVTASGLEADTEILVNGLSSLRTMPTAAAALAAASSDPAIRLNSSGTVRVFGVLDAAGSGGDLAVSAASTVFLDGLIKAADSITITTTSHAPNALTLSQLLLKSDSSGRLLDSDNRLINQQGYLVDENGALVDADGIRLPAGAKPVPGGAPIRLSGGSLNASHILLQSQGGMLLAGGIGELSVSGDRLVSATDHVRANATGNIVVSGRIQTEKTVDLRSASGMELKTTAVTVGLEQVHLLGQTVLFSGYASSDGLIVINGVSEVLVTGTAQSGDVLRVHAGVGASWTDSQLLASGLTAALLTGGNVTVRDSGILDAITRIEVAAGGRFELAAAAVVTPNLKTVTTPVIVQREKTIDVVVGTRQVAAGTKTVEEVSLVPTQVQEVVGSQTVRIGTAYHTLDVKLTQEGYYNGRILREYFVEKVDYQNVQRTWSAAPVIPWSAYRVLPDGTVYKVGRDSQTGGGVIAAPEADRTVAQLTDDQRSVVLDVLGFLRIYSFSYTNALRHQTVNGNTTIIPWTPDWKNDNTVIVRFAAPGLSDKYVRLPEGAREDFLRIVSQGFQNGSEVVGRYRDQADVRYTQVASRLQEQPGTIDDFDNDIAGWRASLIGDAGNPYGFRNSLRQYEIYDGRLISGATGDQSIQHAGVPIWYGGSQEERFTESRDAVRNGTFALAPLGFNAETSSINNTSLFRVTPDVIVGLRRFTDLYARQSPEYYTLIALVANGPAMTSSELQDAVAFLLTRTWRLAGNALVQTVEQKLKYTQVEPFRSWLITGIPDPTYNNPPAFVDMVTANLPGFLASYGYNVQDITSRVDNLNAYIAWQAIDITQVVTLHYGYSYTRFSTDISVYAREDYKDYDSHWIGNWHDVTDNRSQYAVQWVTRDEDVFGTVPMYATVTKTVPVTRQVSQTVWETQNVIQQQTVLVTERVELPSSSLVQATFENESLRAGKSISIITGQDATFVGLTRASSADGEISVLAGRDVLLDGMTPGGVSSEVAPAVADLRAGLKIEVSGGRNVILKKDAVLQADDGNSQTASGVIRLAAGETLTVQSDSFGGHEVYLQSGGDVLLQAKMTSGHLIDVQAGLGTSGIGSVITNIETDLETLGSEINLAAGSKGGDLLLTNAQIFTAGPITLAAPAGSLVHSGGQILADSLSAVVRNGITANLDVRTVSASVTGSGDVNLTTSGPVTLASVTVASGSVAVEGFGDITAQNVTTLGGSGGISLTGLQGNLTLGNIFASGTLDVQSDLGQISSLPGTTVAASDVNYTGQVAEDFAFASDDITLITRTAGDVVINYTGSGPLTLRQVYVLAGSLIVHTPGDLIVLDARLLSNTGDYSVQLNAGGNVLIDHLDAGEYAATEADAAAIRSARGLASNAPLTTLN